ncbi:hypothetical protein BDV93DRAFT_603101 [Ceratobasidium sp. AG-I]|nr:hypothetical protein BDV93DRAFT_603101 [Ceratobasidium sp. AG-I]
MDVRDRAAHGLRDLRDNRTCQHCRKNKLRCTGERPRCAACIARNAPCEYDDTPAAAGRKRPAPTMSYAQVKESRQRKRAAAAQTSCDFCRNDLRRKCDGLRPSCQSCIKRGGPCVYSGPASVPPPTTAGSSRQKAVTTSPDDDDSDAVMHSRDGSPDIPLAEHAPVKDSSRPHYPLGNGLGHAGSTRNPDGTNCTRPVACFFCIHVEIPCTGDYPTCVNCIRRNLICNYPDPSSYAHQFPRQSAMHTRQLKDVPATRTSTRLSIDSSTSTSIRNQPASSASTLPTPTPPSMSASPDPLPYTPTASTPTSNPNNTTFRSPSNPNLNPSSRSQPPTPTQTTTSPSERVISDVRVHPSDARVPVGGVLVSPSGRTRDGASLMRERSGSGGHTIPYSHGRMSEPGEGDGFIHEGPSTYRGRIGSGSGAGMGAGGEVRINDGSFRNGLSGGALPASAASASGTPSMAGVNLPVSIAGRPLTSPTRASGSGHVQRSPGIQIQPPLGQTYQQPARPASTQNSQQSSPNHAHQPSLAHQPPPAPLSHAHQQQPAHQQPSPSHASQPTSRRASLAGATIGPGATDTTRGAPSDAMGRMALDGSNQNKTTADAINRGAAEDQVMRSVAPDPPARNAGPDPSTRSPGPDSSIRAAASDPSGRDAALDQPTRSPPPEQAIRNAAPDTAMRSIGPDPPPRSVAPDPMHNTALDPPTRSVAPDPPTRNAVPARADSRGLTQVQISAAGSPVVLDPRAAEARVRAEEARARVEEPRSRVEDSRGTGGSRSGSNDSRSGPNDQRSGPNELRRVDDLRSVPNDLRNRPDDELRRNLALPPRPQHTLPMGRLPPRTLADPMREDTLRRRDDPRWEDVRREDPRRESFPGPRRDRYDSGPSAPLGRYDPITNHRRDSNVSERDRRDSLISERDRRDSTLSDRDRRGSIPGPGTGTGREVEDRVWQPGPGARPNGPPPPQTNRAAGPLNTRPLQPAPLSMEPRLLAQRGDTGNGPSPRTPRNPPLELRGGGGPRERSPPGGVGRRSGSPTTPHRSRAGSRRRSVSPPRAVYLRAESGSMRSSPMDMDSS